MHRGLQVSEEIDFTTERETLLHEFRLVRQEGTSEPTSLVAEDVLGNKTILCTLVPEVTESVVANIILQPGEKFKLSTSTKNAVYMSYLENEKAPSPSTSLLSLRVKSGEKVLITGDLIYSLVSIVSCACERLSVCIVVNGEEVTIANLVPGKIETAEISLESFEGEEIQMLLVGKGEVELIGHMIQEESEDEDEDEGCSECEGQMLSECKCLQSEESIEEDDSVEINDNEYISDEKMESLMGVQAKAPAVREKRLSKEERKKAQKQEDLRGMKIVDVLKSKNKQVAKKTDTVKVRYSLFVNNKLVDKNKSSGLTFKMGTGQMIRGLELGVEGMAVGAKRTITVPPHLGYGSSRVGGIAPNSTLVFQVELCSILSK
ncbi:uncharacterized protein NEMAJ01_0555 [Nematocida major]|uniref:uncharacterized protein n=1 Tax=Nematocida major TaxID=1912982 RepID=UPI0020072570|nr:uncharacterized protein NEMAJ01_0555 [Nematocida major]KAH9385659.1 hypothetical protein NEMAJ01_0555 [Nematocida major]